MQALPKLVQTTTESSKLISSPISPLILIKLKVLDQILHRVIFKSKMTQAIETITTSFNLKQLSMPILKSGFQMIQIGDN